MPGVPFYIPPLPKGGKKKFYFSACVWDGKRPTSWGFSPRAPRGLCLSVCVGGLVCFGFVSGGGLQVFGGSD